MKQLILITFLLLISVITSNLLNAGEYPSSTTVEQQQHPQAVAGEQHHPTVEQQTGEKPAPNGCRSRVKSGAWSTYECARNKLKKHVARPMYNNMVVPGAKWASERIGKVREWKDDEEAMRAKQEQDGLETNLRKWKEEEGEWEMVKKLEEKAEKEDEKMNQEQDEKKLEEKAEKKDGMKQEQDELEKNIPRRKEEHDEEEGWEMVEKMDANEEKKHT